MIMNSTNDNLPMNRHSIKAGVMGSRDYLAECFYEDGQKKIKIKNREGKII